MANNIRFLDPTILSKISNMELRARTVVEGFIYGLHRSPYRGFSVEFAEYREYAPGDDTRFIDWKVYARSDRYYLKEFEEETNLNCHILLDTSASMKYAGAGLSKLEYGSYLAACLGYLIFQQRDGVGLMTFDNAVRQFIPARNRRGHLLTILRHLENIQPAEETELALPLHQIAESINKKGLIILISDLLDDPESVLAGLQHIRFKGHDLIVFNVMDDSELNFPFQNATKFIDMESPTEYMAIPSMVREKYMERLEAHIDAFKKGCGQLHADYHVLNTSQPLDFALFSYLTHRAGKG